jgi:hypothetical protein
VAATLLIEGFGLMRERFAVYALFALACAAAGWAVLGRIDLYDVIARHPLALVSTPPLSVVLLLALVALFFILPSALRRIEPGFRMNGVRVALTAVTIVGVAMVTEVGYALLVIPGIVVAVLCSQALLDALLRLRAESGPGDVLPTLAAAVRGSIAMTRTHFVTTLGVISISIVILLVPFTLAMIAFLVLGVRVPQSLVITAPLLFLTFIYFECVRYALIVRWYRRLARV